ncbi:MAG TPA: rhodanese-like domain-containing protein [Nitrososphaeraceae archaeon]|nr:rhodanese-like domain-containing protein [Nitrososphaeraceae archaeon]
MWWDNTILDNMIVTVDSKWLAAHLDDLDLIVIDGRGNFQYRFGHIKNARVLGIERIISLTNKGANLVVDSPTAEKVFGELGINDSKIIVVYGEYKDPSAARIVWTLTYHGHPNTKLLDIGFSTWQKAGLPISRAIPPINHAKFISKPNPAIRADAEMIKLKQNDTNTIIVDSRTPQEHMQARIPDSILHSWEEGLDTNGITILKSKEELQKDFEHNGITNDKEVICYCHSGARASHKYLQLKQAGFRNVRVYDGSIIDWAQRHNPLR